jgi:hypothetical protein
MIAQKIHKIMNIVLLSENHTLIPLLFNLDIFDTYLMALDLKSDLFSTLNINDIYK